MSDSRRRLAWSVAVLVPVAVAGWMSGRLMARVRAGAESGLQAGAALPVRAPTNPSGAAPSSVPADRGARQPQPQSQPTFVDVAARHGIVFSYQRGETGEFWLPETMGGGVAWLDYDGDGLPDLFLVQGCQLPRDESGDDYDVLFRNVGAGQWEPVPRRAGPCGVGYGMGAAVGDVDNDGFDELYVTNFGPDVFYHNNGDGTFSDRTDLAGLGCPLWGTSAAFGDLDRDGDLDLFVANYVEHDPKIQCVDPFTKRRKYCGPDYYQGQPNVLYENRGDGTFADVSSTAGVVRGDGKGLGVVIADLVAEDGWPDIFVANDLRPNLLFRNASARSGPSAAGGSLEAGLPRLRFEEVGEETGAAVNAEGVREANMGIACGDYDEDGDLDLYVTHYYMEHDTLWQNLGPRGFADVTKLVGLSLPTLQQLSWGTNFIDFDNDGWLDLFVSSGHINESQGGTVPYAMHPQLFANLGSARRPTRFADTSSRAGAYFQDRFVGRSSAAADFDRDGRIDLAVTHHHRPPALLHNESDPLGQAIGLCLVGRSSNRSAIGARVTLTIESTPGSERRLVRELIGGGSYLASDSRVLLVGLDSADRVQSLDVRWPSGLVSRYADLRAGRYWLVREGEPVRELAVFGRDGPVGP